MADRPRYPNASIPAPVIERPGKSCEDCHYFSKEGEGAGSQCRHKAPSAALIPGAGGQPVAVAFWPATRAHFWCGEFEPKED